MSLVAGCSQEELHYTAAEVAQIDAIFQSVEVTPQTMIKWGRSCALCHVTGEGGAPLTGDLEDWAPRVDQGYAQLLASTLEGKGKMPPLGYCMECEVEDFAAMIKFMVGQQP